jgi:tRNA threonylcarbamoyladenosine biosynthesis protein TsaB
MLLAIDTSSNACSVALQSGDDIAEKHVVEARAHTKILLPMITDLFQETGITAAELDAVVLGNGPGSFIGMRIGASVAQGIAYGAGLKIVPISSLATVAAEVIAEQKAEKVLVAQDARMGEVYIGRFHAAADGLPVAEGAEQICQPAQLAGIDSDYIAAGAAWQRYSELPRSNNSLVTSSAIVEFPRARYLLRLGSAAMAKNLAIAPEELQPAYIRMKVAEPPSTQV